MPRVLADGKTKLAFLTERPANPAAPTASELEAGIDMSCAILSSDFEFTAAASDTRDSKTLCQTGNAQRPGLSNHTANLTIYRFWKEEGGSDAEGEDAGFEAVKVKSTPIWAYARKTEKFSDEPWEAGDEIYMGGEFLSDTPAQGALDDDINVRTPLLPQRVYDYIAVGSGGSSGGGGGGED